LIGSFDDSNNINNQLLVLINQSFD